MFYDYDNKYSAKPLKQRGVLWKFYRNLSAKIAEKKLRTAMT